MVRRLIEEEYMWLNKERTSQGNTHTPTTTHVFCRTGHHSLAESKTVEDTASLGLKRIGIHLLEFLVRSLQSGVINIVCDAEIFDTLLEFSDLFAGGGNDEVDGVNIGGFSLTTDEINVDV
jgi:hypothetical protein